MNILNLKNLLSCKKKTSSSGIKLTAEDGATVTVDQLPLSSTPSDNDAMIIAQGSVITRGTYKIYLDALRDYLTAKIKFPIATDSEIGGIRVGKNLSIDPNTGVLDAAGDGKPGPVGPQGPAGKDATVAVGSVATGAPGTDVIITNSGEPSGAVFNFTIPRGNNGEVGAKGDKGDKGDQGIPGKDGAPGPKGDQGIQGPQGPKGDKGDKGDPGTPYTLGIASATQLGGIKVGETLTIDQKTGVLNAVGGGSGSRKTVIADGDFDVWTPDPLDYDVTFVAAFIPNALTIKLDRTSVYRLGTTINIVSCENRPFQVICDNDVTLDVSEAGRGIQHNGVAFLTNISDSVWVLRGSGLRRGFAIIDDVVDPAVGTGQAKVILNSYAELLPPKIAYYYARADLKDKLTREVVEGADIYTHTFGDLEDKVPYIFKAAYINEQGEEGYAGNIFDFTATNVNPITPRNFKVVGYRGARVFVDFVSSASPVVDGLSASHDGTNYVKMGKDPYNGKYWIQWWPTDKLTGKVNTTIKALSGTKTSPASLPLSIDYDAGMDYKGAFVVTQLKGRPMLRVTWEPYDKSAPKTDDPDCKWIIEFKYTGGGNTRVCSWDLYAIDNSLTNTSQGLGIIVNMSIQTYGRSASVTTRSLSYDMNIEKSPSTPTLLTATRAFSVITCTMNLSQFFGATPEYWVKAKVYDGSPTGVMIEQKVNPVQDGTSYKFTFPTGGYEQAPIDVLIYAKNQYGKSDDSKTISIY